MKNHAGETRVLRAGCISLRRMKNRKGRSVAARTPSAGGKCSNDRWLVPLDQGPIRRKTASECSREMTRLEKVRAEWKRFEQEDKPAFERWMAATFGALLSRLRDSEATLREKEALIHEVEMEMVMGGARSYRSAFARVMHRRTNPPPLAGADAEEPPSPEEDDDGFESAWSRDIPEFEQHLLFEDFLRMVLGINPDRMSEKQYEKMFTDFQAKILGNTGAESPPRSQESASRPPKPGQTRLKEIYRVLVRRLHPDTRADKDSETSALWHEVQEAYGAGNIERLEMLLALTDIRSSGVGEHTSLFQMRAVLKELRRSFNALQRSVQMAKKEMAWNFARLADRSTLQARLQRQIESDIAGQQAALREIEMRISGWGPQSKARKQHATAGQEQFPF